MADIIFTVLNGIKKRMRDMGDGTFAEVGAAAFAEANTLASNVTLAAGVGTAPITGVRGGTYIWDAQWTGAGSLTLQALASDGGTWRDVATLTASGTLLGEVLVGANATLRVINKNPANGVPFTSLYSVLS